MNISGVECCFCKKNIERNDALDVKVYFNSITKEKDFQLFFTHFDCFKTKLHPSLQGYFIRDDIE